MRIVITGGNRGIGLGLTRHYLAAGHRVHATARLPAEAGDLRALGDAHPGRLEIAALAVDDDAGVASWAGDLAGPVDVLINNAGTYGPPSSLLEDCEFDHGHEVIDINAFGPLRVARAVSARLRRPGARVVNITSLMGSIGDNGQGGSYFYRMSKSALNMASRNLALEWREAGLVVAVVHPGWVQTRMGGPQAPLSVEASCRGIAEVIDGLGPAGSGAFFNYDGRPLPW